MTPSSFRDQIVECFNISELKDLCFDLNINYENLAGETLNDISRELVGYCCRYGKVEHLVIRCSELRPHLTWEPPQRSFPESFDTLEVGWSDKQAVSSSEIEHVEITSYSPLLVGLIIDLSRPMLDALVSTQGRSGFNRLRFRQTIDIVVEKTVAFCKTPEADDILPRLNLFVYGYGFGQIRKRFASFLQRIGVETRNLEPESIPSSPLRDLFSDASERHNLPLTPSAVELNHHRELYQRSIEAQFLDMGLGESNLYESLLTALNRFNDELKEPHYKHPILLLISTGRLEDAVDEQLGMLVRDLQTLGVITVCCYVGSKNIWRPRRLYVEEDSKWPIEAKRLFHCSSIVSSNHKVAAELIRVAIEKGWEVPDQSHLFIQLNNNTLLEELTEILLSPLSM